MNNRFVELAYEAKLFNGSQAPFNEVEKFAELIVQECMRLCYNVQHDVLLSDYERDALLCYQEIQEHFGVEE